MAVGDKLVNTEHARVMYQNLDGKIGDLKSAINPVVTNGLFTDKTITSVSAMQGSNQSFTKNYGWFASPLAAASVAKNSPFSNQLKIVNASAATSLMGQDIDANEFKDGTYYFNAKIKSSTSITIRISIIRYPTAVNSNGTTTQSDAISIPGDGEWHDVSYSISLSSISTTYNHLRVFVQFNSAVSVAMTEVYFGMENYGYSHIESALDEISGNIDEIEGEIEDAEEDYNKKIAKVAEEVKINSEAFVPVVIRLDRDDAEYTEDDIINVTNGEISHATLSGFNSAKWDISDYAGRTIIISGASYTAALAWVITDTNGVALLYAKKPSSGTLQNHDTFIIPDNAKYLYYCAGSDGTHVGALTSMTPMIVTGYENNISGTGEKLIKVDPSWEIDGRFMQTKGIGSIPTNPSTSGYAIAMIRVLRGHTYHVHSARIYKQSSYILTDEYFATKASDYDNTRESVSTLTEYDGNITPTEDGWLLYQTKVNNVGGYFCSAYGSESLVTDSALYGKSLYVDGDSIAAGIAAGGVSYGDLLAAKYAMTIHKYAVDGGTICRLTGHHCIPDSVVSHYNNEDFVILDGGYNDYGNNTAVGGFPQSAEQPLTTDPDATTFVGGMEKAFQHIMNANPTAKIWYLIPHRIYKSYVNPVGTGADARTFADYVDAIRLVCNRYGVEILDVFDNVNFNTYLDVYKPYTRYYNGAYDMVHPTLEGYQKFYMPYIDKMTR